METLEKQKIVIDGCILQMHDGQFEFDCDSDEHADKMQKTLEKGILVKTTIKRS